MNTCRTILASLLLAASASPSAATVHRGVWFWGNTTLSGGDPSPFGSSVVVGDSIAEDETVLFFATHGVKRVYGSYQNRPVSEPAVIAAWNAKLDAAGIQSQLLLDGSAVNDPAWVAGLLDKIQNRFIDFNSSQADPANRFDALHLDLEPQGLPEWDTPAEKRALLDDLAQVYQDIRVLLDGEGFTGIPIYADINFSWDKLPADGGSVAWTDAADRDGWYAGIGDDLDGVSVMTFSKETVPELEDATLYERTGSFPGTARIAIQAKGWPGEMWESILEVYGIVNGLESAHAPDHATDIENYAFWRHSLATTGPEIGGVIEVEIDVPVVGTVGGTGPVISFTGAAGYEYVVKRAGKLDGNWEEAGRYRVKGERLSEEFRHEAQMMGRAGFWKVEAVKQGNR